VITTPPAQRPLPGGDYLPSDYNDLMGTDEDGAALAARSRLRRERIVAHRASGHADAEAWDLDFWQSQSPEDRLSALVAIRRDVEAVEAGRKGEHH
jgi:hypothetical protein